MDSRLWNPHLRIVQRYIANPASMVSIVVSNCGHRIDVYMGIRVEIIVVLDYLRIFILFIGDCQMAGANVHPVEFIDYTQDIEKYGTKYNATRFLLDLELTATVKKNTRFTTQYQWI